MPGSIKEMNVDIPNPEYVLSELRVLSKIESATYTMQPSGKTMICELILKNGFSVIGRNSVVYKENFNEDLGRKNSYENALEKVWELEGYLFQEKLYLDSIRRQN